MLIALQLIVYKLFYGYY